MAMRDLIARVLLRLDQATARAVQGEIRTALRQGTDPTEAQANLGKVESKIDKLIAKAREMGQVLTIFLFGRAIARFVDDSIQKWGEFDQAMTRSTAIMQGVTSDLRAEMEATARSLAEDLNIPAAKVAEGFYFLASAGLTVEQSIAALPVVAKFAKAGVMDLAQATEMLMDSQAALGLSSRDPIANMQQMTRVANVLAVAANVTNASVEQFAESLAHRAAATMRQFNISVEEGTAVLMAYAQQGTKGQRAGEEYMRLINRLTGAMTNHRKAWEELGLSVFDTNGKFRPVADIIDDLTKKTRTMSDAQRVAALENLGFVQEAQNAIRPLLGQADAIRAYTKELENSGGAIDKLVAKQMKGFNEMIGQTRQQLDGLKMDLGKMAAEGITEANQGLFSMTGVLKDLRAMFMVNSSAVKGGAEGLAFFASVVVALVGILTGGLLAGLNVIANVLVGTVKTATAATAVGVALLEGAFWALFAALENITSLGGLAENPLSRFFKTSADAAKKAASDILGFAKSLGGDALDNFTLWDMRQDPGAPAKGRRFGPNAPGFKPPPVVAQTPGTGQTGTGELAKQKEFLRSFNADVVREVGSAYDIAMNKIADLEAKARELFGKHLPDEVRRGLQQMRAAAREDEALRKAQTTWGMLKGGDAFDENTIARVHQFTLEMQAQAQATKNNAQARDKFNQLAQESLELEGKLSQKAEKDRERRIKEWNKSWEDYIKQQVDGYRNMQSVATNAAYGISGAFQDAFARLFEEGANLGSFMEVIGRQIGAALLGGLAQFAAGKVAENIASAFENHAKATAATALGLLGNPLGFAAATMFEAAAIQDVKAAAGWAVLAGAAGAAQGAIGGGGRGGASGGVPSGASDIGGRQLDDARRQGPAIIFEVHEFDPMNPRAQERLHQAKIQYEERYGGTVEVRRKTG